MAYRIITFARAMSSTFGKRTGLLFKLAVPVLVLGLLASIAASVVLPVYIGVSRRYMFIRQVSLPFTFCASLRIDPLIGLESRANLQGIQNYLETFDFVANQKAAKFKLYTNIQLGTYLVSRLNHLVK